MTIGPFHLAESFEWAGFWWLPEADTERVPGVLRYNQKDGLSLSLIGGFDERIMSITKDGTVAVHGDFRRWPVVHGMAERREFTLLDCFPRRTVRTFGARVASPEQQTVEAGSAIVGQHLASDDQKAFSSVEVSLEDLGYWANTSPFCAFQGGEESVLAGKVGIASAGVEPQNADVDDGRVHLVHGVSEPYFADRRGETIARMRDTSYLRIVPDKPFSLQDTWTSVKIMQDLISLATHRAAGLIWLRLGMAVAENEELGRERKVAVLSTPMVIGQPGGERVQPHKAFFNCGDIPFEEVVPRWFRVHEQLQAASNMILGLRYAPPIFLENQLLTAVGAAEVLHRRLGLEAKPLPDNEFQSIREAILGVVPDEYRVWIKERIRNSQTLKGRLLGLSARLDSDVVSALMPNSDQWAARTVRARNDLAHEGKTPRHSVDELIAVVEVTTAVVVLNLLHEIGLPATQQLKLVQSHHWLQDCAEKAGEWFSVGE